MGQGPFSFGGSSEAIASQTGATDSAQAVRTGIAARDNAVVLDRIKLGQGATLNITTQKLPDGFFDFLAHSADAQSAAIHDAVAAIGSDNQSALEKITGLATTVQTGGVSNLLKGLLAIVLGAGAIWATVKIAGSYFATKR